MTVNHGKIGDTERDRAVEALGVHFAQGRLQLDEYERRTDQALYAETLDELDQVFIDLPLPRYDSVIEPYRRAQVPTSVPTTSNHTWTRTTTPPSGKTRIWKRPWMSKIQAISVGCFGNRAQPGTVPSQGDQRLYLSCLWPSWRGRVRDGGCPGLGGYSRT